VFYVVLLVAVLLGGALAVLVIENFSVLATATQLSFFIWRMPLLPMGLWLLISCLYGALLLYLLSILSALWERRELKMLRQRVAELEQAQATGPRAPLQAYPPPIVPIPGISTGPLPPSPPESQK
jgi:uncharacterized integral membrane protein